MLGSGPVSSPATTQHAPMSAHGTPPVLHRSTKCIHHHIHMRTTRWQQSDAGCAVSECSIPAGAAAERSRGSILPDWQHAGVEHATPAARCAVGTPGAELGEEWSTLGPRASLTGGRQMSNMVGGGSGGPCGWLRRLGRRMRKTARSCEATWQVEQWYYYHLELCIHWRWEERPSVSETASCRGWQQMRGAHLSGWPAPK